jgi:hypothetical protein
MFDGKRGWMDGREVLQGLNQMDQIHVRGKC